MPDVPETPTPAALASADELKEIQKQLLATRMELSRTKAMRDFPGVKEEVLNLYQGSPDGIYDYAKVIHQAYGVPAAAATATSAPASAPVVPASSLTPPAGVEQPVPTPGPGASITPDSHLKMRLSELREKAKQKQLDVRNFSPALNEANEYFSLAVVDGLLKTGKVRRRT